MKCPYCNQVNTSSGAEDIPTNRYILEAQKKLKKEKQIAFRKARQKSRESAQVKIDVLQSELETVKRRNEELEESDGRREDEEERRLKTALSMIPVLMGISHDSTKQNKTGPASQREEERREHEQRR